jgi:preprotein translocase subunit SecA
MLQKFFKIISGDSNKKILDKIYPIVDQINNFESELEKLSDNDLKQKTFFFKEKISNKLNSVAFEKFIKDDVPRMPGQIRTSHDKALAEVLEEILPEAFAVCREASRRVLNMRHFDVQLIGGIQLHRGGIAEMQTGEGKTLVCTLPAYLNGLTGRGVHVVTVNDYLAQRDSEWMGKLYNFLGLSVGLICSGMTSQQRQESYGCDISYGTNNEFGFDYLRDNMETDLKDCVQRPYYMAIVDEVDSILIDEARTPLIISGLPDTRRNEIYQVMAKISKQLKKASSEKDKSADAHYYVDEKARNVILTDAGIHQAESLLKVKDLWDPETNLAHHLIQALRAKELFSKDTDYIVKPDEETGKKEIVIVDEFTGRLMEGRRWSDGLHQAVEAKEGVSIQEETLTMASITFQNLFRLYPKLAGMTGTAMTEAEEFEKIYNLGVLCVPTNRSNIRKDLNDLVLKTESAKYFAIAEDIVKANANQIPVLVGTTSIEKSEYLAGILSKPQHTLKIVEQRLERLLKLIHSCGIKDLPKEFKKLIDRPGNLNTESIKPFIDFLQSNINKSSEDLEFAVTSFQTAIQVLDAIRKGIKFNVLNAKHHKKEAEIIREAGKPSAITIATNMAGRGTDIILGGHLSNDINHPDYSKVDIEAQNLVKERGGLYVIGSERHESRRIDNQLRGRCARQGDPGASKFYLSLEDNLMRIFGGDKVIAIMNMLKADEDLPIEANIISGAINNSQKKVEAHNFDIRKHVLQYDDVINTQREVIYRERRMILEGADIHSTIESMISEHIDSLVYSQISPNQPVDVWFDDSKGPSPIAKLFESLKADFTENVLKKIDQPESFKQSGFDPLLLQIKNSVKEIYTQKEQTLGVEIVREAERQILLHVIDTKWIEHLHAMDSLKDGIHLQGYGQKDPLIEYKKESFDMFDNLLEEIRRDAVVLLFHAQVVKKSKNPKLVSKS